MAVTRIDAALRPAHEAEQQRRREQKQVDEKISAAIAEASQPSQLPAYSSKESEKRFHEERTHIASELTRISDSRLRALDVVLRASTSLPTANEKIIELLRAAPSRPEPEPAPKIETFLPPPQTLLESLVPGAKKRHADIVQAAHDQHSQALSQYESAKRARQLQWEGENSKVQTHNEMLLQFVDALKTGIPQAVTIFFEFALGLAPFFPQHSPQAKVAYVKESKHLVIDYELPDISAVPEYSSFNYVRARRQIQAKALPARDRKRRYASLLSQLALAALSIIFRTGLNETVDCVTLNGVLNTTDPATGRNIRPCLFSVRTTRETFESLTLDKVSPIECLKALKANVSASPDELVPVRPILELNMVDSRFVQSSDVLSALDDRTNLMDLSPTQFEELITNLFAKMGLETRLTQASRDGGVDCVAFDQRPILGGKVVIQAKRYKNTVGVSAVRDLFGTMQNEGASKGILVTTSGYGKAAFDFAAGKPLELLDGSNLLHLLEERAGLRCKIVMPDNSPDYVPN
jgi:restriction system protein